MTIKSELIKKYNVAGPRYTSYPTVPYWAETPKPEDWLKTIADALDESRAKKIGAAIYVHVPFCEALCTYCGCNTRITRNHGVAPPYIDSVLNEWALYRERLGKDIPLTELHLGGGTPTFLSPSELKRLIEGILKGIQLTGDHEFSIEADPRVTRAEHLQALAALGFKRLSLGIQDFDPKVQEIVHRVQSEEQVRQVTETAREQGFESVNYDLIYGLPLQTQSSVRATIETVQRLRPDRIAFYAYAHVPWIKPAHRRFTEADLPSGDDKRALYELGRKMLEEVGYREIGMDHFALESDSLWTAERQQTLHRGFMGYTSRQVSPLIGLGVSAIGDSWNAFAQNEKLLETYEQRVAKKEIPILRGHILNEEDRVLRRHILNLMTRFETSWKEPALQAEYLSSIPGRLDELAQDGLVKLEASGCSVTEEGRAFLRNVCMAFDARLNRQVPTTQLFSKTI
jgi:oxygen-independent coproporphyrinogen-3 oxidase